MLAWHVIQFDVPSQAVPFILPHLLVLCFTPLTSYNSIRHTEKNILMIWLLRRASGKHMISTKEAAMKIPATFSAKQWVSESLISSENLKPETLLAVESFTLMWAVFEGLVCDNSATMSRLEKLSSEIIQRRRCQVELERIFRYFQAIYYTEGSLTVDFDALRLRLTDRKSFIEAVLQGERSDFEARILALLFILSRIHNNLFHGPKALDTLNSHASTLNAGCRALATIIEAHGRHFKRARYAKQPLK